MLEIYITDNGIIQTEYNKAGEIMSHTKYPSEDNIPEPVRSQLAALKLMPDSEDVPGIGQKVSSKLYWIYDNFNQFINSQLATYMLASMTTYRPMFYFIYFPDQGVDYEIVRDEKTVKTSR